MCFGTTQKVIAGGDETFAKPVRPNIMDLLGIHSDEESGPRRWANHELFEAGRPGFHDVANKSVHGSKGPYQRVRKGFAKVS